MDAFSYEFDVAKNEWHLCNLLTGNRYQGKFEGRWFIFTTPVMILGYGK
jgi:hypothetical protein